MDTILIYDTTLRDGTQGENVNFSAEEKIKIARRLDDIGVHFMHIPGKGPDPLPLFMMHGYPWS